MGTGCSKQAATGASTPLAHGRPEAAAASGDMVVDQPRASFAEVDREKLLAITEQVLGDMQARRAGQVPGASKAETIAALTAKTGADGLLAKGLMMAVYGTGHEVYSAFIDASPGFIDMPTPSTMASNAMAARTMAGMIMEYQAAIEAGTATCTPNTALAGTQLDNVLRFKALWGRRLLGVTLVTVPHPVLGVVVLCHPLLHVACMQRVFNGPTAGSTDALFGVLLGQGAADPNVRSGLGMVPLAMLATAYLDHVAGRGSDAQTWSANIVDWTRCASEVARLLLSHGADPAISMRGFGCELPDGFSLSAPRLRLAETFLKLDRYTALAAYRCMRRAVEPEILAGTAGYEAVVTSCFDEFEALLLPPDAGMLQRRVPAGTAAPVAALPGRLVGSWAWTQGMSNVAWAAMQIAMVRGARQRRVLLQELIAHAPFVLPPMRVVSVEQLRELGCIPRFSSDDEQGYRPLPADGLPDDAVVVFMSHRWIGNGCPDDNEGTKLRQVLRCCALVAAELGVAEDKVYPWLDFSVADQSNPMPAVQMLPAYIACCEVFVSIEHPQYWERAWCLTEQFMAWRLNGSGGLKFQLKLDGSFVKQDSTARPPDPTFGKLAFEADRVALAAMTSILPYDQGS